jgi:hypothetical protein
LYCAGILQYLVDCRCFTPKALECIHSVVDFEIRDNGETGGGGQANLTKEGRSTETGRGGQAGGHHDRSTPPGATPPVRQSGSNSVGAAGGDANRDSMEQVNNKRKRQQAGDELMNDSDVSRGPRGQQHASSSADDNTKDLCRWFTQCKNTEKPAHTCFRCNLLFHNLCRQRNETCSVEDERNELSYYCGCTGESLSEVAEAYDGLTI